MTQQYTVSDLVAEFLRRCDATSAFGIVSVHNIPLLDAYSRCDGLNFVMARNEMGAAHMADAWARASGKLGLVITSTGPGASNAVTGLLEAECANTPMLHLTGQTATKHRHLRRGTTHDVPDQSGMLRSVGKAAYCVHSAAEVLGVLTRAVTEAWTAPCGPVSVELPIDIQKTVIERPVSLDTLSFPIPPLPQASDDALQALIERVRKARRPMLWLGSGARFAGEAVTQLLGLGFGLVTSWAGRGVVSESHPMNLGCLHGLGAPLVEEFYADVDLLIVAGSRLRGQETLDFTLKLPKSIVQIDIDPSAEGRTYVSDLFVCGDAASALALLAECLQGTWKAEPGYAAQFGAMKQAARAAFRETLGPYRDFPEQLRAVAPENALFVRDITVANSTWGHRLFPIHQPRDSIYSVCAGIGQGLPMAAGAAVAAGAQRKTILLSGDGGFVLNLSELYTVAQENLNLVMIVMNDSGYSVIKHMQDVQCSGNRQYGDLLTPDFALLARSAGIAYLRVDQPELFGEVAAYAMGMTGPVLLEVDMNVIGAHPPYFPYSAMSKN